MSLSARLMEAPPSLKEIVVGLCLRRLGHPPNLDSPAGYNDLIQWLKLHDQRSEHIVACDKYAVRDVVKERAGAEVLIPLHAVADAVDGLNLDRRPLPYVVKATHDSGSATIVGRAARVPVAIARTRKALSRLYGVEKGEWAYQFVPPRAIVETRIPGLVTDYKFHCAHNAIRWCQVIADRASGIPRETIFSPTGAPLQLHMDHKMRHAPGKHAYPGHVAWSRLTDLAQRLAAGWRYVRVDLYWSEGRALFGELTFWPLAGCYLTRDEPAFGTMLDLDLTKRFEPIVR